MFRSVIKAVSKYLRGWTRGQGENSQQEQEHDRNSSTSHSTNTSRKHERAALVAETLDNDDETPTTQETLHPFSVAGRPRISGRSSSLVRKSQRNSSSTDSTNVLPPSTVPSPRTTAKSRDHSDKAEHQQTGCNPRFSHAVQKIVRKRAKDSPDRTDSKFKRSCVEGSTSQNFSSNAKAKASTLLTGRDRCTYSDAETKSLDQANVTSCQHVSTSTVKAKKTLSAISAKSLHHIPSATKTKAQGSATRKYNHTLKDKRAEPASNKGYEVLSDNTVKAMAKLDSGTGAGRHTSSTRKKAITDSVTGLHDHSSSTHKMKTSATATSIRHQVPSTPKAWASTTDTCDQNPPSLDRKASHLVPATCTYHHRRPTLKATVSTAVNGQKTSSVTRSKKLSLTTTKRLKTSSTTQVKGSVSATSKKYKTSSTAKVKASVPVNTCSTTKVKATNSATIKGHKISSTTKSKMSESATFKQHEMFQITEDKVSGSAADSGYCIPETTLAKKYDLETEAGRHTHSTTQLGASSLAAETNHQSLADRICEAKESNTNTSVHIPLIGTTTTSRSSTGEDHHTTFAQGDKRSWSVGAADHHTPSSTKVQASDSVASSDTTLLGHTTTHTTGSREEHHHQTPSVLKVKTSSVVPEKGFRIVSASPAKNEMLGATVDTGYHVSSLTNTESLESVNGTHHRMPSESRMDHQSHKINTMVNANMSDFSTSIGQHLLSGSNTRTSSSISEAGGLISLPAQVNTSCSTSNVGHQFLSTGSIEATKTDLLTDTIHNDSSTPEAKMSSMDTNTNQCILSCSEVSSSTTERKERSVPEAMMSASVTSSSHSITPSPEIKASGTAAETNHQTFSVPVTKTSTSHSNHEFFLTDFAEVKESCLVTEADHHNLSLSGVSTLESVTDPDDRSNSATGNICHISLTPENKVTGRGTSLEHLMPSLHQGMISDTEINRMLSTLSSEMSDSTPSKVSRSTTETVDHIPSKSSVNALGSTVEIHSRVHAISCTEAHIERAPCSVTDSRQLKLSVPSASVSDSDTKAHNKTLEGGTDEIQISGASADAGCHVPLITDITASVSANETAYQNTSALNVRAPGSVIGTGHYTDSTFPMKTSGSGIDIVHYSPTATYTEQSDSQTETGHQTVSVPKYKLALSATERAHIFSQKTLKAEMSNASLSPIEHELTMTNSVASDSATGIQQCTPLTSKVAASSRDPEPSRRFLSTRTIETVKKSSFTSGTGHDRKSVSDSRISSLIVETSHSQTREISTPGLISDKSIQFHSTCSPETKKTRSPFGTVDHVSSTSETNLSGAGTTMDQLLHSSSLVSDSETESSNMLSRYEAKSPSSATSTGHCILSFPEVKASGSATWTDHYSNLMVNALGQFLSTSSAETQKSYAVNEVDHMDPSIPGVETLNSAAALNHGFLLTGTTEERQSTSPSNLFHYISLTPEMMTADTGREMPSIPWKISSGTEKCRVSSAFEAERSQSHPPSSGMVSSSVAETRRHNSSSPEVKVSNYAVKSHSRSFSADTLEAKATQVAVTAERTRQYRSPVPETNASSSATEMNHSLPLTLKSKQSSSPVSQHIPPDPTTEVSATTTKTSQVTPSACKPLPSASFTDTVRHRLSTSAAGSIFNPTNQTVSDGISTLGSTTSFSARQASETSIQTTELEQFQHFKQSVQKVLSHLLTQRDHAVVVSDEADIVDTVEKLINEFGLAQDNSFDLGFSTLTSEAVDLIAESISKTVFQDPVPKTSIPSSSSGTPSGLRTSVQTVESCHFQHFKQNVRKLMNYLLICHDPVIVIDDEENIEDTLETLIHEFELGQKLPDGELTSSGQKSFSEIYGIPAPPDRPVYGQVSYSSDVTEVFFDIKIKGQQQKPEITQIAARRNDGMVNVFVMPGVVVADPMSRHPGSQGQDGQLFSEDSVKLRSLSLQNALENFCAFLDQRGSNVLVGHNIENVCLPRLFHALFDYGMVDRFCRQVKGFVDIQKLFKNSHPSLKLYKQRRAQDAEDGALFLQQLVQYAMIEPTVKQQVSFTTEYALGSFFKTVCVETNMPSLENLVNEEPALKKTAEKIAGSGLNARHLEMVFVKHGREGIRNVFSEIVDGKPRVTKNKKDISLIAYYFEHLGK